MMNSQRNDSEKDKLIEKGKRMAIKQNNGHAYNQKKKLFKTHIRMIKINTKIYTENYIHGITVNKKASKRL